MLSVNSFVFYENVATRSDGTPLFSGKYEELIFDKYPITTDLNVFAIEMHAIGDFDGLFQIKVFLGEQLIHETAPSLIHGRDEGGGGNIGFHGSIQKIKFPTPGIYKFDILFNNEVLHSASLTLLGPTPKKRKRH